jgi:protoporphyrinogen oxidase
MMQTLTRDGTAVILGAGPAGLAAGLALARAGWRVEVFERDAVVGGLARTVERDGFRFDIGGHRWFTKKDHLNHFLVDVVGDELVMVDRISRIYFEGKYVDYPLRVGNVLSKVGPSTSARAIGDFVKTKVASSWSRKPVVSMEDAYVAQFGQTLYELFFRRYSEKVWGGTCDQLSGDWVEQRSRGLTLPTLIRDAITPNHAKTESLIEQFMYPRLGFGRICERMAAEIEARGGSIHVNSSVVGVRHNGRAITSVVISDGHHERSVLGDAFISSIPMTHLAQLLRPGPSPAILEAAGSLGYRDLITVNVMIDRPQVSTDTWVYVHEPRASFARLHEPRNWSPDMAPPGKTSLVLEFFCDAGDALWQRSDDDVCDLAVRELQDVLGFVNVSEVMGAFAIRSREAYPRYSLGYGDPVAAIGQHLRSYGNLSTVGRGGTFRYNNTDHAIETGLIVAGRLLGQAGDVNQVNSQREYLEMRRRPGLVKPARFAS